jgi:chemotaxis protein methyltransferase CheR
MGFDLPDPGDAAPDDGFQELLDKVGSETPFQGQFYKSKCLRRRFAVRMRAREVRTFAEYGELLDVDPAEYDLLLDTLTINVSKFFRNAEIWRSIDERVLPRLFTGPRRERRVWSAGCAAGEEAYSVSILLHEWAARHGREAELEDFRIVGTDIDRRSLAAATRGEYTELAFSETSPELRGRWFSAGPPYRLDARAMRNVSFAQRDLISGEPEEGLSLILCRNVIIYFDREIQERLFQRFHDALLPGGFLILGKVETLLGRPRAAFRAESPRDRIFRKPE